MDNYLKILEESLNKKLQILAQIHVYNEKQREVFQSGKVVLEQFDEYLEEKGELIARIAKLDDGFEVLYANVAEELKNNKEKYAEQIGMLQQLVKQVTDKSIAIQVEEARNKELIEEYFAKERRNIRQGRRNAKTAFDYYASANKTIYNTPQFMDSKR